MSSAPSTPDAAARDDERYWALAFIPLLIGIALRQWRLGDAPFHPDEAIHAFFAGGFAHYTYDPVYHGPLLYHLVALAFGLFGQNDFAARLVPSLLGILLLWMVLVPLRSRLGDRGALWTCALLAVSPAVVTYSRRLLHDSLVLVLTLGAVTCFLTTLDEPSGTARGRNSRIGLMAFLTLFLATKANVFFVAGMLLVYWFLWKLSGSLSAVSPVAAIQVLASWFAVIVSSILLPRAANSTPVVQSLQDHWFRIIVIFATGGLALWILTRDTSAEERADRSFHWTSSSLVTYIAAAAAALWIYVFLFGSGVQILSAALHRAPNLHEQFDNGAAHARSAVHDMLKYWGGQQAVPRLPGRHDYYLVLLVLYEVPVLIAAVGGVWHAMWNRSRLTDFLLWWAFTSWAVYAVANEKVPWLSVHIVLPFALLGGQWLGHLHARTRRSPGGQWALGAVAALCVAFDLRGVSATNFERSGDNCEPLFYAQTPEAYRDAVQEALERTRGDMRTIWMNNSRQWPTVWYLRDGAPGMDKSHYTFSAPGQARPEGYRFAIAEEAEWDTIFVKHHYSGKVVDFLVWPRASWCALHPKRYIPWFVTRDTLPQSERSLGPDQMELSILSHDGEWSHATTVVGYAPVKYGGLNQTPLR